LKLDCDLGDGPSVSPFCLQIQHASIPPPSRYTSMFYAVFVYIRAPGILLAPMIPWSIITLLGISSTSSPAIELVHTAHHYRIQPFRPFSQGAVFPNFSTPATCAVSGAGTGVEGCKALSNHERQHNLTNEVSSFENTSRMSSTNSMMRRLNRTPQVGNILCALRPVWCCACW
jgi:hypothetical protein